MSAKGDVAALTYGRFGDKASGGGFGRLWCELAGCGFSGAGAGGLFFTMLSLDFESCPPVDFAASEGHRGLEPEVGDHTNSSPAAEGTNSGMVSFSGRVFAVDGAAKY